MTPPSPPALADVLERDDILIIAVEECGEVIQAITKCLRFGYDRNEPGYGVNCEVLAAEIGDLIGCIDALPLDWNIIAVKRREKIAKATAVARALRSSAGAGGAFELCWPCLCSTHCLSQGMCNREKIEGKRPETPEFARSAAPVAADGGAGAGIRKDQVETPAPSPTPAAGPPQEIKSAMAPGGTGAVSWNAPASPPAETARFTKLTNDKPDIPAGHSAPLDTRTIREMIADRKAAPTSSTPGGELLTDAQIKHMVDRFLGWRLPKPWHPDNGISYQRLNYARAPADHDWPTGTNLFDCDQATAMVRYMIEGLPGIQAQEMRGEIERLKNALSRLADDPSMPAGIGNFARSALRGGTSVESMSPTDLRVLAQLADGCATFEDFATQLLHEAAAISPLPRVEGAALDAERQRLVAWLRRCGTGELADKAAALLTADAAQAQEMQDTIAVLVKQRDDAINLANDNLSRMVDAHNARIDAEAALPLAVKEGMEAGARLCDETASRKRLVSDEIVWLQASEAVRSLAADPAAVSEIVSRVMKAEALKGGE